MEMRKHTSPVDKKLMAGIIILLTIIILSFAGQILWQADPFEQGDIVFEKYLDPSIEHPLGTDKFGRDYLSRVLYAGRISLLIAAGTLLFSLLIGLPIGALSGYFGGIIDSLLMRLVDIFLAVPPMIFILSIVVFFRPDIWGLIIILSITSWMEISRIVRAEFMSIKEKDYISAAQGFGFNHLRIIIRHIFPNCISPVITLLPLKLSEVLLTESALSFLGVGVRPPIPSWGSLINEGESMIFQSWWLALYPGIAIILTVVSFHLLAECLEERFQN